MLSASSFIPLFCQEENGTIGQDTWDQTVHPPWSIQKSVPKGNRGESGDASEQKDPGAGLDAEESGC